MHIKTKYSFPPQSYTVGAELLVSEESLDVFEQSAFKT